METIEIKGGRIKITTNGGMHSYSFMAHLEIDGHKINEYGWGWSPVSAVIDLLKDITGFLDPKIIKEVEKGLSTLT